MDGLALVLSLLRAGRSCFYDLLEFTYSLTALGLIPEVSRRLFGHRPLVLTLESRVCLRALLE